jgi:hypothetical protein
MCGMPFRPGCKLCQKYGNGHGKLLKEYGNIEVNIDGKIYKPKCHFFKGKKAAEYTVWDDRLVIESCSDRGAHAMPRIICPCHVCDKDNYEKLYEIRRGEILSKPI